MTIKELLIEADAIQVGVVESDWQRVIKLAARPLEAKGFISTEYSQAVIDNTLNHGAYYVFDEGIAIPHARPGRGPLRPSVPGSVAPEPAPDGGRMTRTYRRLAPVLIDPAPLQDVG